MTAKSLPQTMARQTMAITAVRNLSFALAIMLMTLVALPAQARVFTFEFEHNGYSYQTVAGVQIATRNGLVKMNGDDYGYFSQEWQTLTPSDYGWTVETTIVPLDSKQHFILLRGRYGLPLAPLSGPPVHVGTVVFASRVSPFNGTPAPTAEDFDYTGNDSTITIDIPL